MATPSPLTPEGASAAAAADVAALLAALTSASGNVSKTALNLGIPRRTLNTRINALGLRAWLTAAYPRSKRQPKR